LRPSVAWSIKLAPAKEAFVKSCRRSLSKTINKKGEDLVGAPPFFTSLVARTVFAFETCKQASDCIVTTQVAPGAFAIVTFDKSIILLSPPPLPRVTRQPFGSHRIVPEPWVTSSCRSL
jgi:hypothetical protein